MPRTSLPTWSELKRGIAGLAHPDLVELVRDLAAYSPDNRLFLAARSHDEELRHAALEEYRWRIVEQFFPDRGYAKLGLGEARRAIGDYRRATADPVGTLDLMLSYLEAGTEFAAEAAGLDQAYFRSMLSMLDDVVTLLHRPGGVALFMRFRDRLASLARTVPQGEPGFADAVRGRIASLGDLPGAG
jgi:hypothetical protein